MAPSPYAGRLSSGTLRTATTMALTCGVSLLLLSLLTTPPLFGFFRLSPGLVKLDQIVHRLQRVGMFLAEFEASAVDVRPPDTDQFV